LPPFAFALSVVRENGDEATTNDINEQTDPNFHHGIAGADCPVGPAESADV